MSDDVPPDVLPGDASFDAAPPKPKFSPADVLPPVEPPSVSFLLQLFLIPLLIVSVIVVVWMMFSWVAQSGADPKILARGISKGDGGSWQKAVTLSQMLSARGPEAAKLRQDGALCKSLADVLTAALKEPVSTDARTAEADSKLRMYLARTLGEFDTLEGLDALLVAATTDRDLSDVPVRLSAIEGLSSLAGRVGPETLRDRADVMDVLASCSKATDDDLQPAAGASPHYRPRGEIRGAAAFALGVLGGEPALDRLERMLDDAYPNVRYNATTGLSRWGDPRAAVGLKEMLDPDNAEAGKDERSESEKELRRMHVFDMGVFAAKLWLRRAPPDADRAAIVALLQRLADGDLPHVASSANRAIVKSKAIEAVRQANANADKPS